MLQLLLDVGDGRSEAPRRIHLLRQGRRFGHDRGQQPRNLLRDQAQLGARLVLASDEARTIRGTGVDEAGAIDRRNQHLFAHRLEAGKRRRERRHRA
ncbi:MAG: hypothetical protein H6R02_2821, partial [Burkholderiaceae bacterium]|nr:hypothetical protein [Burkholderiaceae bacterium]